MHTAELQTGMWVHTPAGLAQVHANTAVYTRKQTQYWRTIFVLLSDDLESIELHVVSHAGYVWLV